MSSAPPSRTPTGALIVTLVSFFATLGCMLGLVLTIPRYVYRQGAREELVNMFAWGAFTLLWVVVFCMGMVHLVRARRGTD